MNKTASRTDRRSNFVRRSWRLAAGLLVAVTVAVSLGLVGAAPASASTSVYNNAFIVHPDSSPCHLEYWSGLGSLAECGFDTMDVAWVTAQQYVVRQDSASAYYPGRGEVAQRVSNPVWNANCNQNQCSVFVPVAVPPWVTPYSSTQWISSTGLYSGTATGSAEINPGFTWVHLHTDVCVWDGKQWAYHKSIDHYLRADLSVYS